MSQADVDLKGNTNFVVLKDLNDAIVVPRTNLAAVDMTVANGLKVTGNTLYFDVATEEDIEQGTTGQVVTAEGIHPFLDALEVHAGDGIVVDNATVSTDRATAEELIVNASTAGVKTVSNEALNGALSSGKAVDVTSTPSASAGTLSVGINIKADMTWTGTASGMLGFYNSSTAFPKFADGLDYLMLADIKNNGTEAVTLSADNAVNGSLPVTLEAGETARVAMIFKANNTGYISAASTENFTLGISNLRQYEVTGCSQKAREYIATIANPDDYNSYYLIDAEEVNPWTPIINMGNSPVVTLQAGLAYKLHADDGNAHSLMVDTLPSMTYGRDAHISLYVGTTSYIQLVSPLRMQSGQSFTANTLANCTVTFNDGIALLNITSTESGYIVVDAGAGTTDGTLYYGLGGSTATYLVFNPATNGEECSMAGAVANADKEFYGNGAANTIVVGNGTFGNHAAVLQQLTLKGATVSGSSITVNDGVVVDGALTNNGAITVGARSTLVLNGSGNQAIGGTGSVALSNGSVIDASTNDTGAILMYQGGNISVGSGSTVTLVKPGGGTVVLTAGSTASYLLANGSVTSDIYIVSSATGDADGSLYYGFATATNGSIIFAKSLDEQTVTLSDTATVSRAVNVIGNGTDKTTVTGAFDVAAAKSLSLQDLVLTGSTVSGSSTGKVYLYGTSLNDLTVTGTTAYCLDNVIIPAGATVHAENTTGTFFPTSVILNGDLYMKGTSVATGTTITGTGTLHMNNNAFDITNRQNITLNGITLTDTAHIYSWKNTSIITLENVAVIATAHSSNPYCLNISGDASVAYVKDSVLDIGSDAAAQVSGVYTAGKGTIYLSGTTFAGGYLANGTLVLSDFNKLAVNTTYIAAGPFRIRGNTPDVSNIIFVSGSTMDLSLFTRTNYKAIHDCTIMIQDNVQILLKNSKTLYIDACIVGVIDSDGYVAAITGKDIVVTGSTLTTWKANNAILASPLDAHEASTVQLSGTTFSGAAKISGEPMRIQLPAATTVSLSGNTNAADTKILQASLMMVSDNPASGPNGSATVVNAAGTTSTVTGMGTYIDKEGDNDFTTAAVNSVTVATGDSATAGTLASALAATTDSSTGANRWVKLQNNISAVVDAAVNAVNKQIITHDYEPILGGTFALTSATVSDATKTVAIQSGGTMSIVDAKGGGSVIDLGGTHIYNSGGALSVGNVYLTSGNGTAHQGQGGAIRLFDATAAVNGATISGNSADAGGGVCLLRNAASLNVSASYIKGNTAGAIERGTDILVASGAVCNVLGGCEIGGCALASGGTIAFMGSNKIDAVLARSASVGNVGSVTISSGAILDLTGNTNTTVMNPGGGITFAEGGATIYPSAGSASAYMLGGVTVPQIGNTNVVDLGKTNVNVSSGGTAYLSGCTITGGSASGAGAGAIDAASATVTLVSCVVSGCSGFSIVKLTSDCTATISGTSIYGNNPGGGGDVRIFGGTTTIVGCNIDWIEDRGNVAIAGTNTIGKLTDGGTSGTVTISSGVSINLTSSIVPGGGITVLTGGCTVNGTAIAAGTYTSIASSGGSAVAN